MGAFESFEHAGFVCELHQDEDPMSPAEWDELGVLHSFKRADALAGFEDPDSQAVEAWERERPGLTLRYLRASGLRAVLFQYQDYGSSGARLLALDDDDDRIATGYSSCPVERMASDGPVDGDWRRALEGELENWDALLQGMVCGYVVRDKAGEVVDSCWGFYPEAFTAEERARYGRPASDDGLEFVRMEAREAAERERDARAERSRLSTLGWGLAHGLEAMPV